VQAEPFRAADACTEIVLSASDAFRRESAGADAESNAWLEAARPGHEGRLLAMLQAGLIGAIDPVTTLPWNGEFEWATVRHLLLPHDDFVRFASYQGVEIVGSTTTDVTALSDLSEVAAKSWPHVLATIAALVHLSRLESHKVASSVVSVLEKSKYPLNVDTVGRYLNRIKKMEIKPQGEVPSENYKE
jgi:hypothetical protein